MGREQKIKKLRREGILKPVKVDKKRKSAIRKLYVWIPSVLIIIVLVFGIWAYSAKDISATVNSTSITNAEVEQMLEPVKANMQQQGINPDDPEQSANVEKYRSSIIEMLVNKALFEQYAKSNSIEVNEEDLNKKVDEEIANIKAQYGSQEEFENQLKQSPLRNEENLRKEIVKSIEPTLLEDAVLNEKYEAINITDEDARVFFNAPASVEAQRIFIATDDEMDEATLKEKETQIQDIRTKIANNELSFDKAVTEFSEDNASKVNNGKIYLQEGSYEEEPELWEAVQTSADGDLTGVIKTDKGYSIILVNKISRNKERYNRPENADVLRIVLQAPEGASETEINELLQKATGYANTIRSGGETFENIATTYSVAPEQGTKTSTVYKGSNPEQDEIIFNTLEIGQVSDPIKSGENTVEIVKLVNKYPAFTATFENSKEQVISQMDQLEKSKIREDFIESQRQDARISHSNPWQRMNAWWNQTFGGFFESIRNWVRLYTVDPIPDAKTPTGDSSSPVTIPIQGEDGQTQNITIDPSTMESIDVPVGAGQTEQP